MASRRPFATVKLTYAALLTALQVVLGNITQIPFIGKQFNFGFLPIIVAGALLGAPWAALVGALGDFIGAHLFPQGAYFPGFTLTSALAGLVYGLLLRGGKAGWLRVIAAVLAGALLNLVLNSLWLSILYGSKTFWGWISVRFASYLVEAPVQIVLSYLGLKGLERLRLPALTQTGGKERT